MNFSKYLSLTILVLSFTTNSSTQCMETKKFDADIDLNNPEAVKDALIHSARWLVNSKDSTESQCIGFDVFYDLVAKTQQGFDDAETACINGYKENSDQQIKHKILDLLCLLNYDGYALETGIKIATEILMSNSGPGDAEIKNKAHKILYDIIAAKQTDLPESTLVILIGEYYTNQKSTKSHLIQNIMNKMFEFSKPTEASTTTSEE